MLEIRGNSAYFYRSRRVDGRVVREYRYGGRGLLAQLAMAFQDEDDEDAELRALERAEAARAIGEMEARARAVEGAIRAAIGRSRAFLEAIGFRQHDRGAWRRRRGAEMGEMAMAEPVRALGRPFKTPNGLGSMATTVVACAAKVVTMDDPSRAEAFVDEQIGSHARRLAGAQTTMIEWSLCQTAALCWWDLRMAEAQYFNAQKSRSGGMEHHGRHVDRLRRRYAFLLKSLADVRRLAGPIFHVEQLNLMQVNNNPPDAPDPGPGQAEIDALDQGD